MRPALDVGLAGQIRFSRAEDRAALLAGPMAGPVVGTKKKHHPRRGELNGESGDNLLSA